LLAFILAHCQEVGDAHFRSQGNGAGRKACARYTGDGEEIGGARREVAIETGIGASIHRSDTEYKNAGASMASGFAGIENPLFFKDNTSMIFGEEDVARDRERI
jgi:NAD/NADP transhydrogenase alpha subunit